MKRAKWGCRMKTTVPQRCFCRSDRKNSYPAVVRYKGVKNWRSLQSCLWFAARSCALEDFLGKL